jgi:hypothetical protein
MNLKGLGRKQSSVSIHYDGDRGISVGTATATGWSVGSLGFDSRQGQKIFPFSAASRPALGPTQPPIQWATGTFCPVLKQPRREDDHSPPSNADVNPVM